MVPTEDNSHCRIIVDAMGGDHAPQNAVIGAVQAALVDSSIELILAGQKKAIIQVLQDNNLKFDYNKIIDADQVISMSESPTIAIKSKPNSSIVIGTRLVHEGKADAFVSAGNTGAVVAAATFNIGRLKGVERPTIGTYIPNSSGITTIFDVGAFVDSKPAHLLGYGIMSSIYVKEIYGIPEPTVALLSVGEEDEKGNKLTKEAFELLKRSKLNFKGNVEGRDILAGKVNIVLCDGFVGNILLKFGESVPKLLKHFLVSYSRKSFISKIKVGLFKNVLKEALLPLDYQAYGGVPLLGVNGICIIGHGSSSVTAIKNMVLRAKEMFDKQLTQKIEESLKSYAD